MNKHRLTFFIILIITIATVIFIYNKHNTYDINLPLKYYNILNTDAEKKYMDQLKNYITPTKLRPFIKNYFVPTVLLTEENNGNDMIDLMKFTGYELLFKSLFDKTRTSFDDCPVTDNFKNKFNTNLLDYYNLKRSDDAEVNCSLDMKNKKFDLEVYGIIGRSLNLEPNYYDTHHFTYTLDPDGNVDDVVFNQK